MQQPKILVAIRKRPLSKKQASKNETDIVAVKTGDTVIVSEYKQKVDLTKFIEESIFNFDYAFNQHTQNQEIYDVAVRPLVDSAFQGAKVTCFAYGQTGSGKTYTMNGNMGNGVRGLYTLGAADIFAYLQNPQFSHLKAKLSFFQIYCGKLFDLLNKRQQLKLREDNKNNINIIGLEEAPISSCQQFINYLALGSQQRVTSQNSANADSSRSHAILQVSLKDGKKLFGKISFIDLAGSERGADHMDMDKQTRIDGAQINKSLLSLKECIRALDQGKGHTPFRGSKLTMVLKDSFVGFCRTVMIGNVSPSSASSENTLNTLRYADRVKQLRKPQEGGNKEEMKAKEMMLPRQNKNAIRIMINNDDDADDIARKRNQAQKEYGVNQDDASLRKISYAANIENGKQSKSSSIAKDTLGNALIRPLQNNLIANHLNNKKPSVFKNDNTNVNKYSHQTGALISKGLQAMDIEWPSPTPYYLPSNKNIGFNQSRSNHSNLMSQNNLNRSVNSQLTAQKFQNKGVSNQLNINKDIPYQGGDNSYGNYGQNNGYQKCTNIQNAHYQSDQNINHSNFSFTNYSNKNNSHNFPHNYVHPQNQIMPNNWKDLTETMTNNSDPMLRDHLIEEMNGRLLNEEDELMSGHSDTLKREIDVIKQEMHLLNEVEVDRGKITSRAYVRFMHDSIEEKISQLQMLRQRLISFTYKLDQMEEMEGTGRSGHMDDEQLLDDIN